MNMDPSRLWAKSKRDDDAQCASMFLPGHLQDVHTAAQHVLHATADDQLSALGLDAAVYRKRLDRCVLLAAAVHDLGKANDHFQGMLRRIRDVRQNPQGVRHEWVTVLILKQFREWLMPAVGDSDIDFAIVEWAVAGHHPAFNHPSPPRNAPNASTPEITIYLDHCDLQDALDWLAITFSLPKTQPFTNLRLDLGTSGQVFPALAQWERSAAKVWDKLSHSDRRFVAAVKNCLVAADISGSALPKADPDNVKRWSWITESFAESPKVGELQRIVDARLKDGTPRDFQLAVANSTTSVTFVKAGCGSGKTLAAYMWAAKEHPTRRIYICYPTTGTATEGFKDYLHEPDVNADLFHSRRDVDFEIILDTGGDSSNAEVESAIHIDSLDAWSTPIVACTVDTVLGVIQNHKRGLFAWPALAQSAFVFDEIHAYDDCLFGALLRFLCDLPGLPSLLMTASLPKAREDELRRVLKEYRGIDLNPICGPKELEELPRYKQAEAVNNDPMPLIREMLANDGKVLWVCNTVARVMDAAARVEAENIKPCIYHSRFKYEDRVQRHKAVIDAFDPNVNPGGALAVCTQVAEMSLDLSADLLVTDLATVPACIQRLGRLNRRAKTGDATKSFVVITPDHNLPYLPADFKAARDWLFKLTSDGLSQKDLADAWEQSSEEEVPACDSAWLDGGPKTVVTDLREGSLGITVLMADDLPRVRSNRKALMRLTLPMPSPKLPWQTWPRERGLPIAPPSSIAYDPQRGAEWRK
jgi:CRISPR-associated endonuclease/helicase Cas3